MHSYHLSGSDRGVLKADLMSNYLFPFLAAVGLLTMTAFPKAGVYVGNIPVTLGYVLLMFFGSLEILYIAINKVKTTRPVFISLAIGFFGLAILQLSFFRIYGYRSMGNAISIMASTLLVPGLSILSTTWFLRTLGIGNFVRTLRLSLLIVFSFGMVSFFAYNASAIVIGVPYVTTTGDDITEVFQKHNLRGPIVKMFSTYNNGNILGLNLLLWGPMAAVGVVPSLRYALGYRAICLLTLSRSVWVGLLTYEFISAYETRSLLRVRRAFGVSIALVGTAIMVSVLIGKDPLQFLLDKDLGGRVSDFNEQIKVISTQRIAWDGESVYTAAWMAYGPLGLLGILSVWLLPIFHAGPSLIQRTARVSMIVYMLIAAVEGAFNLIPTQFTYWMVASIAISDFANPRSISMTESKQVLPLVTENQSDSS